MDRITPHFLVRFVRSPNVLGFIQQFTSLARLAELMESVLNERLGQVDSQPVFMTPTVAS
jgi:hypothetical protein